MRITNAMVSQQVLFNVNQSEQTLSQTEEELSSGKTINQPSDNPYGASVAVSLNGQLSNLTDYTNNVTNGQGWTSTGLSALSNMTSEVQRAQELITGAMNGTQSSTDLQADGAEIQQLIQGIKSDANTQYDGQYVFGGGSTTAPYDTTSSGSGTNGYTGGTATTVRTVGPGQTIQVSTQLSTVLNGGSAPTSNTGLLDQLQDIADRLNGTGAYAGDAPSAPTATDLDDIQSGLTALTTQATTVGAASESLTMASSRLQTLQTNATSALSDDQDADYATVATDYSNEQAAFSAALKAGASIVQSSLMDFLSN